MLISIWIPTGGLVLVYQKFTAGFFWLYWTNPLQYALNAMTSITFYCDTKSPQVSPWCWGVSHKGGVPSLQLL